VKPANDGLRFLLELCALASLGYWGWQAVEGPGRWALAFGAATVAGAVSGTFVAPKASFPIDDPWRLLVEIAIFGSAVAALAGAERPTLAAIFACDRDRAPRADLRARPM
jgi:Protein of unknown function (DUF2568)